MLVKEQLRNKRGLQKLLKKPWMKPKRNVTKTREFGA
jgi:hypothetical protein